MESPIWVPDATRVEQANITAFSKAVEKQFGKSFSNYTELYRWSIEEKEAFWSFLWDFCEVIGDKGDEVLRNGGDIEHAEWFPKASLNFAQNLLRKCDNTIAITFRAEDKVKQDLTYRELYEQVAALAAWLREQGVAKGDRVAAIIPNMPQAIIGMLATTAIGAVWTSVSPDFGEESIIDRFGQTEPKILLCANGYFYNGKVIDVRAKVSKILAKLPTVESCVMVKLADLPISENLQSWDVVVSTKHDGDINFEQTEFNHPLYILYSSGTTGKPKCITHKVGGVLLQHLKEHQLHSDIKEGDPVFYFTTCGWMMWNWLVSVLASKATVVLYDGSPFYPDGRVLWDYADEVDLSLFGTSAKYIDALKKAEVYPAESHKLKSLNTICSTGSVLAPESFDFVYESIKSDVNLASISGGTDIVSCFVLGNPVLPVYRGESQCRGLGLAVEVFDQNGEAVNDEKGELVCTQTFPSQPVYFWDDADGKKYHKAYFSQYENIWHHGDYVRLTPHGGVVIYGRSDSTLNPGGVRIGTAEIYRHVEQLDEVFESIVIGQDWDSDIRVVLFVVLKQDLELDDALTNKIRTTIRQSCSPRHVPAKVIQVPDIPRTKSGKLVELAVRDVIHGREVNNIGALANPQSLQFYQGLDELKY